MPWKCMSYVFDFIIDKDLERASECEKERSLCRSAFMIWLHIKRKPFSYLDINFHRIQCNLFCPAWLWPVYMSIVVTFCFASFCTHRPTDTFHSLIMLSFIYTALKMCVCLCANSASDSFTLDLAAHDRCLYKSYLAFITLSFSSQIECIIHEWYRE